MSFGIIGVSPPTLKIANGVQKINKVHMYNQTVSQELNMYNSENYMCVADLMINMDRPRTIVTACKNVKEVRPTLTRVLEWSDPEDTIINCTHEHYKHSMYYENECSNKNVHYLSASLTNDAFLVGGQKRIFKSPINGTIIELLLDEGETCQEQQPLVHVVDTSKCRFICNVEEQIGRNLKRGQTVELEIKAGSGSVNKEGKVIFVSPVVDPASGLLVIKVEFENHDGMVRPGVSGEMILNIQQWRFRKK